MEIDTWLSNFQSRMRDVQQKAAKLTEDLTASTATKSSADGSVTVHVGANGALQNLELGRRSAELTPAQLSAVIMRTVRDAQRAAAEKVGEALQDFGDDGAILRQYAMFQPPDETPSDMRQDRPPAEDFALPPDSHPAPPAGPPAPARPVPPAESPASPAPAAGPPVPPPPAPRPARPARPPRAGDSVDDEDDVSPW